MYVQCLFMYRYVKYVYIYYVFIHGVYIHIHIYTYTQCILLTFIIQGNKRITRKYGLDRFRTCANQQFSAQFYIEIQFGRVLSKMY